MHTFIQQARRGHTGLFWFATAMAVLVPVLLVLSVVDGRTLLGADLWFKPLKFAVSFFAYAGTLAWLLGRFPRPTLVRTGWVIAAASAIEMVIIGGQAARGTQSHFNMATSFDSLLYSIMGGTVAVIYLCTIVVAVLFLRQPSADRPVVLAIRFGLAVSLLGMTVGVLMSAFNGHAVGVADGGPGLPFVGWSTTGGDLRIGHFLGMHALQVLPIAVGLLASAAARGGRWKMFDERALRQSTVLFAGTYTAIVALVTWQALRAQPLLSPDLLTSTVAAAIVSAAIAGAGGVLRAAAKRSTSRSGLATAGSGNE